MSILEIRLLKFGVYKLPLNRTTYLRIKFPPKTWSSNTYMLRSIDLNSLDLEPSTKGQLLSNCRDEVLFSSKKFFFLFNVQTFFFLHRSTI